MSVLLPRHYAPRLVKICFSHTRQQSNLQQRPIMDQGNFAIHISSVNTVFLLMSIPLSCCYEVVVDSVLQRVGRCARLVLLFGTQLSALRQK
jgi:hypothetical protein